MSDEKPHVHICRAPFGLGTYFYKDENGKRQSGYGIWNPKNPFDFFPDPECCTPEEMQAWKDAKKAWAKRYGRKRK